MQGPRTPQQNELNKVYSFLDKNLRPDKSWSLTAEYPLAFTESNLKNIHIISEGDEILSHAVTKHLMIKTPLGIFKVAAIGSVVTDPKYRNQGLSRQVISRCLDEGLKAGCDFAILWTNLYDFYRKLGFELAGSEISIVIENELEVSSNNLKFMATNKVSPEALWNIYSKHTVGTMRSAADIRQFLAIPNTHVYTAWDQQNNLQAYAIEGKGADLNGYLHEWGGNVSSLIPLIAEIRKSAQKPITLIAPKHSQNLIRELKKLDVTYSEGFLGMIKPLDTRNLFFKVHRYARSMGVDDFVLEQRGDNYYIGQKDHVATTDSLQDITRIIFGPPKASEIHNFEAATAETLEKLLPVPMWIWGWDSV